MRTASASIIVLLFTLTNAGCAFPNQSTNSNAVALYESGHYQAALRELETAKRVTPNDPDVYYNLGCTYEKLGDVGLAETNFDYCLNFNPNHAKCRHAWNVLMLSENRDDEAYDMLMDWVDHDPINPDPLIELAWFHRQLDELEESRDLLRQALEMAPNHPRALTELGSIYEEQGRHDRALVMYRRALQSNPNHSGLQQRIDGLRSGDSPSVIARQPASRGRTSDLRYRR